jgi:ABC-type Fe3+ transport system permease subunit/DNA-binding beta-propeller fold protein YncE
MNPLANLSDITTPLMLFTNSLLVAAATTLAAVLLGMVAALFLIQTSGLTQRVGKTIAIVSLVMPPFLVTSCWLDLLGFTGIWKSWLPLDIYSLPGAVLILALMLWPISALLLESAWSRIGREAIESEPLLAGRALIANLLIPLGKSALVQSIVLTFILALNNFTVPALLQIKVYPASLWVSFNTTFNYGAALRLGWPLILTPIVLLLMLGKRPVQWNSATLSASATLFRSRLGKIIFAAVAAGSLALLFFSIILPVMQLTATRATWSQLVPAFNAGRKAFFNSAFFAAGTATLCLAVALFLWRSRIAKMFWVPFILPGVFLGMGVLWFSRPCLNFLFHSVLIVFATLGLRYIAILWTTSRECMREAQPQVLEAARLSGASNWCIFRTIHLPRLAPQLFAAWYITYLLCLWDAETLILVVPPGAETLALRVFNMLHYGHTTQVNALCLLLLGLAVLPVVLWSVGNRVLSRKGYSASVAVLLLACGCNSQPETGIVPIESKLFSAVQVVGTRGVGAGEFNKPRSLICDRQDNLFVVDISGRVQKFSPDGKFLMLWQMPQTDKGKPKGMDLDKDGNIIVVEPHYSRVNHYSTNGKLLRQWGDNGTNAGQLAFPRSVAVASTGEIFLSEYGMAERIQKFSADGSKFLLSFGTLGENKGELTRAEGICIGRTNELYEADSCNHRIQVFSSDGKFLDAFGKAGTEAGELSYPYDVKVDANGYLFACEFGNSRIQVFDPKHQSVEIIGHVGGASGEMNNPWSIAFDSHGNLYVADSGNNRVQKFLRRAPMAAPAVTR